MKSRDNQDEAQTKFTQVEKIKGKTVVVVVDWRIRQESSAVFITRN